MIKHLEKKKREKVKRLVLTGPFAILEITFFIMLFLPEFEPATFEIMNNVVQIGAILLIFGVIPLIFFYNAVIEFYFLKKFEVEFNKKYPEGLSYEFFIEESELAFPRFKVYIYNNDLFMLGSLYHMISLDVIKTIAFKPILFRLHHRWFLVLNTKKRKKELEINHSIYINNLKIFSELVEPMENYLRDNYPEIELKGIIDI